jgi:hypothetical protein
LSPLVDENGLGVGAARESSQVLNSILSVPHKGPGLGLICHERRP